jgi:hypothetical protein
MLKSINFIRFRSFYLKDLVELQSARFDKLKNITLDLTIQAVLIHPKKES